MSVDKQVEDLRRFSARKIRTSPIFLDPVCSKCKSPLFLIDILDDMKIHSSKVWYDEWTCSNKDCKCNKYVLLDWNW